MNHGSSGKRMRLSLRRLSAIQFLIAIVVLFVSTPFIEPLRSGPLIESILFTIVLISGVLAIADRRSAVIIATVLAVAALAGRWISHLRPDRMPPELFLIS